VKRVVSFMVDLENVSFRTFLNFVK
jgi:hypothetical protein